MTDHIILFGLGKVGFSILELLHSLGETVVVVSREVRPEWARPAERMAARLVLSDGRDEDALEEAGIRQARAIIIATNDDVANLEIALDARQMAPQASVVVRIYDPRLAEKVRRDLDVSAVLHPAAIASPAFVAAALGDQMLRAFDVGGAFVHIITHRVTKESDGAGATLRALATRLEAAPLAVRSGAAGHLVAPSLDAQLQAGDEVVLADTRSALGGIPGETNLGRRSRNRNRETDPWYRPERNPFVLAKRVWGHASTTLRTVFIAIHLLLLVSVAVFRGALGLSLIDALYFSVTTMTTVGYGDISLLHEPAWLKLYGCLVMVSGVALSFIFFAAVADYIISQRIEQALGPKRTTLSDHVVVIGLGSLGAAVARRLHELRVPVIAIERGARHESIATLPDDLPVIHGDATQAATLEQAGIGRARAVVAATNDDLANLRIAQFAESQTRRIRTVVRVFHSSLATKLGAAGLGIDQALNASAAAAATFAACALAPNVLQGFTLGGRLLMLRRLDDSRRERAAGRTVGALREEDGMLILLRQRAGESNLAEARLNDVIAADDQLVVLEEYSPQDRAPIGCAIVALQSPAE